MGKSAKSSWAHNASLSVSSSEENYDHSYSRIALIIFTIVTFLFSIVLNLINYLDVSLFGYRIFESSAKDVIDTFETYMSPSGCFYFTWVIIFGWQVLWLAYGVATIFRTSSSDYLYKYPPVMHWLVYLSFAAINVLNVICLFLWSYKLFTLTAAYSLLMALGLYITTFISLFKLSDYQREMYYTEKMTDVWAVRIFVQNGMALYAAWSFVMFLLALNLSLVYEFEMTQRGAHLVIMGFLLAKMVVYSLVENYAAYAYCKFLLAPWIVYAIYIFDVLVHQLAVKNRLAEAATHENENASVFTSHRNLNHNFLLHTLLITAWVFLVIAKLLRFVWNECCRQKRFSL